MASSQIEITNGAGVLLGDLKLAGLTDNRLLAENANLLYEVVLKAALAAYPWRFAMKKVTLSQLVAAPLNEWKYAYQLPADNCRLERVYPDGSYDRYGVQVYSNAAALDCDYIGRVDAENRMSPAFAVLMMYDLAILLCESITASSAKKDQLRGERPGMFTTATSQDAQQQPNRLFRSNPFVDVRQRGL